MKAATAFSELCWPNGRFSLKLTLNFTVVCKNIQKLYHRRVKTVQRCKNAKN